MHTEFSAGIVVYKIMHNSLYYLLLHYNAGHWDFSKGHIEPGETKQETALRELHEETGISTKIDAFEDSFSYWFDASTSKIRTHKTVYFFAGEASSDKIVLSNEHIDYVWLTYKDALKRLTFENAQLLLRKVHEFLINKYK